MSLLHSTTKQSQRPSIIATLLYGVVLLSTIVLSFLYYPVLQNGMSTPKVFFLYGVVLIGVFLWVLYSITSKTIRVRKTTLDIALLALVGVFLLSTIFSVVPSVSMLGKMNVFVMHTAVITACVVWMWLLVQTIHTLKRWHTVVNILFLVGGVHALIILLQSVFMTIPWLSQLRSMSLISSSSVQVSIFLATIAIIALGQVLSKHQLLRTKLLPLITSILTVLAIVRIGFDSGFWMLAIGSALLIIIGTTYLSQVYSSVIVASFGIFVMAVLLLIFDVPGFLTVDLPVEVGIGPGASWHIAKDTILSGTKEFLLGSGPGTFLQSFSAYRDVAFNTNQLTWSVRFQTPYSTLLAIITEVGLLGTIVFTVILLGAVSVLLSTWKKTRPTTASEDSVSTAAETIRIHVFTVAAAWLTLTVGLGISFLSVSVWVLWWTLLALMLTGLAACLPTLITERRYSLAVSPQYSLVVSFLLVVVATGILIVGVFGTRMFLADISYARALSATTIEETTNHLDQTLRYRPQYVPYQLSRARLALQRARLEAQAVEPNSDSIANYLAIAVNTARQATTAQSNDVETWETLASMYLNTQALVPDANTWAVQALERAIALEPTNPVFQWQMANAKAFAGDVAGAEEQYKQAIRLKPDYIVAYVSLSSLLESQDRLDQAIAVYQPIFRMVEQNPEALFTLGRLFYNRQAEGDLERAKIVLEQAVTLAPTYANARFTLGLVYEALGDRAAAQTQFETVAEQNPDNPDILNKLQSYTPAPTAPPVDAASTDS